MPVEPSRTSPDGMGRLFVALAFLLGAAFRIGLAIAFPTIHGGDATARLASADTFVLGYQLPLPQAFVVLGKAVSDDPLLVRVIFCVWGGILAAGLTALLALHEGSAAAGFGAFLLAFDPLLTHYSIVPYQEAVAYGLLAWAFYCAASNRGGIGAVLMGASCLSRYEAWLFLPAFIVLSPVRARAWTAALPVLGWVLWWQGLGPRGLYVLDIDPLAGRFSRLAFLTRKFLEYETPVVVVLALVALVLALRGPARAWLRPSAFVALVILTTIAFGHEYPPGSGLMSERLIHLPVLLSLAFAAIALGRISSLGRVGLAVCVIATALLGARNARFETGLLRAAASDPDLALAREVARGLESARRGNECVTVVAPTVDPALLTAYVGKVNASFGDVARARERAASLSAMSPDRDRIAAHLKAKTGVVRGEPGCPLEVRVDGAGSGATDQNFGPESLVKEISAGPRRARIYRIRR
jgi:hypothetical protein